MRESRVLVVEDDKLLSLDIRLLVEDSGATVVGVAASAEEALSLSELGRPTVAVIDVNLATSLNGITLARELVARFGTRIVFLTGSPELVVREAWGLTRYVLAKPFAAEELLQAIADQMPGAKSTSPKAANGGSSP